MSRFRYDIARMACGVLLVFVMPAVAAPGPVDVPAWVPLYPDLARPAHGGLSEENGVMKGSVRFEVNDDVAKVKDFYENKLRAGGFDVTIDKAVVGRLLSSAEITGRNLRMKQTIQADIHGSKRRANVTLTYEGPAGPKIASGGPFTPPPATTIPSNPAARPGASAVPATPSAPAASGVPSGAPPVAGQTKSKTPVPPEWIPIYPAMSAAMTGYCKENLGYVTFDTADPVATVAAFYEGKLKAEGFDVHPSKGVGPTDALLSAKHAGDPRDISVSLNVKNGQTNVVLNYTNEIPGQAASPTSPGGSIAVKPKGKPPVLPAWLPMYPAMSTPLRGFCGPDKGFVDFSTADPVGKAKAFYMEKLKAEGFAVSVSGGLWNGIENAMLTVTKAGDPHEISVSIRSEKGTTGVMIDYKLPKSAQAGTATAPAAPPVAANAGAKPSTADSWIPASMKAATLPAWVPSYPAMSAELRGFCKEDKGIAGFNTADPIPKAKAYYMEKLKADGFEVEETAATQDGEEQVHLNAKKDGGKRTVLVAFRALNGPTNVMINYRVGEADPDAQAAPPAPATPLAASALAPSAAPPVAPAPLNSAAAKSKAKTLQLPDWIPSYPAMSKALRGYCHEDKGMVGFDTADSIAQVKKFYGANFKDGGLDVEFPGLAESGPNYTELLATSFRANLQARVAMREFNGVTNVVINYKAEPEPETKELALPSWVPAYPKPMTSVTNGLPFKDGGVRIFSVEDSVETAKAFYLKKLKEDGFTVEASGGTLLLVTKAGSKLSLHIGLSEVKSNSVKTEVTFSFKDPK